MFLRSNTIFSFSDHNYAYYAGNQTNEEYYPGEYDKFPLVSLSIPISGEVYIDYQN